MIDTKKRQVRTTISFVYDSEFLETIFEGELPSDDEILKQCKQTMLEDLHEQSLEFDTEFIKAEFEDEN